MLYFNLHAFDGDPAWKSYDASADRFLNMVWPDAFSSTSIAGSVIISEACYGAQVAGRSDSDSCALANAHVSPTWWVCAKGSPHY